MEMTFFRKSACRYSVYHILTALTILLFMVPVFFAGRFSQLYEKLFRGYYAELAICTTIIIIWSCELTAAAFFCKRKLKFNLIWNDEKKSPLPAANLASLWVLTYGAILSVSGTLGWQFKIIHDLGTKITLPEIYAAVSLVLLKAVESVMICAFIKCAEEAAKLLIPSRFPIPYGGIALFMTYGTAVYLYGGGSGFLYGSIERGVLFWFFCILYGAIYKLSKESFPVTAILVWLIILL